MPKKLEKQLGQTEQSSGATATIAMQLGPSAGKPFPSGASNTWQELRVEPWFYSKAFIYLGNLAYFMNLLTIDPPTEVQFIGCPLIKPLKQMREMVFPKIW